uniref:Uncharacterized protein n=1 Tax=Prevotella sp. GTC17262 TaxID=3236797 RepID=A0AB33JH57_9BACT
MNTTTSISFYDILNYGIIGTIIFNLCTINSEPISFSSNSLLQVFLLGFIYSKICEATLGRFIRMNNKMLEQGARSNLRGIKQTYSKIYDKHLGEYVKSTIILLEASLAFIRNLWPLSITATIVVGICDKCHGETGYNQFEISILTWVIAILILAYIIVIKNKKSECIFLSCIICTLLFIQIFCMDVSENIRIYGYDFSREYLFLFFCLMDITLPFLWYQNQMKIYNLIFELDKT